MSVALCQWSPTFSAQWTSRGGRGCGGRGEKRGWFRVGALLSQMQRRMHTLVHYFHGLIPNELWPSTGLWPRAWGPLLYATWHILEFSEVMNFASFQVTVGESYHKKLQITLWRPLQSGFSPLKWLGKGIEAKRLLSALVSRNSLRLQSELGNRKFNRIEFLHKIL